MREWALEMLIKGWTEKNVRDAMAASGWSLQRQYFHTKLARERAAVYWLWGAAAVEWHLGNDVLPLEG